MVGDNRKENEANVVGSTTVPPAPVQPQFPSRSTTVKPLTAVSSATPQPTSPTPDSSQREQCLTQEELHRELQKLAQSHQSCMVIVQSAIKTLEDHQEYIKDLRSTTKNQSDRVERVERVQTQLVTHVTELKMNANKIAVDALTEHTTVESCDITSNDGERNASPNKIQEKLTQATEHSSNNSSKSVLEEAEKPDFEGIETIINDAAEALDALAPPQDPPPESSSSSLPTATPNHVFMATWDTISAILFPDQKPREDGPKPAAPAHSAAPAPPPTSLSSPTLAPEDNTPVTRAEFSHLVTTVQQNDEASEDTMMLLANAHDENIEKFEGLAVSHNALAQDFHASEKEKERIKERVLETEEQCEQVADKVEELQKRCEENRDNPGVGRKVGKMEVKSLKDHGDLLHGQQKLSTEHSMLSEIVISLSNRTVALNESAKGFKEENKVLKDEMQSLKSTLTNVRAEVRELKTKKKEFEEQTEKTNLLEEQVRELKNQLHHLTSSVRRDRRADVLDKEQREQRLEALERWRLEGPDP